MSEEPRLQAEQQEPSEQVGAASAYRRQRAADSPVATILHHPPSYIARGLVYLGLAFLVAVVAWAGFSRIDSIVEAEAEIVPQGRLSLIEPAVGGVVREILVHEGDVVQAGQPLLILESPAVTETLAELRRRAAELEIAARGLRETLPERLAAIEARIEAETKRFEAARRAHELDMAEMNETIRGLHLQLSAVRRRKGETPEQAAGAEIELLATQIRAAELGRSRAESDFEVERQNHEMGVSTLRRDADALRDAARNAYEQARIRFEQVHATAKLNLPGVDSVVIDAAAAGKAAVTNRAVIASPIHGVIAESRLHSSGQTVERGETVMTIVPAQVDLVAAMRIPGHQIGKVREGQPIRFKFEAFPFAEHGVRTGALANIRPTALVDPQSGGSYYRAESQLDQTFFQVKGERAELLPGMRARAEISTGKRSILSLLFQPFAELGRREGG